MFEWSTESRRWLLMMGFCGLLAGLAGPGCGSDDETAATEGEGEPAGEGEGEGEGEGQATGEGEGEGEEEGGCLPDPEGQAANQPPLLAPLTAPARVRAAETLELQAEATDPDGDPLTYAWTATCGDLQPADAATTVWTAPGVPGPCTITVTVRDEQAGEARSSVEVRVKGWRVVEEASGLVPSLNAIGFAPTGEGWAVGGSEANNTPYILAYRKGVWTDETPGQDSHLHSVAVVAADNVWASGGGGQTFWWDGSTWHPFIIPGGCLHKLYFVKEDLAWTGPAHEGGPGMRRYLGGDRRDWTIVGGIDDHKGIHDIHFSTELDGWAVGPFGRVYHNTDGSDTWTRVEVTGGEGVDHYAVWFVRPELGWVVGSSIVKWDGAAWSREQPTGVAPGNWYYAIFMLSDAEGWLGGAGGELLHYADQVWRGFPSPTTENIRGIWFTDPDHGWAITEPGQVLQYE